MPKNLEEKSCQHFDRKTMQFRQFIGFYIAL